MYLGVCYNGGMGKRPRKDKQLKVLMTPQQLAEAEAFAEEHGGTVSGLVRWFLAKLTGGGYAMTPEDIEALRQESKRPSRRPGE